MLDRYKEHVKCPACHSFFYVSVSDIFNIDNLSSTAPIGHIKCPECMITMELHKEDCKNKHIRKYGFGENTPRAETYFDLTD